MNYKSKVTATDITITAAGVDAAAGSGNRVGNCDTDQFSVTVPGGKSPPAICGVNTGDL